MGRNRDELFIALQRLIPQHSLSRLLGKLADCTQPTMKNTLIRLAMRQYGIDLTEAELQQPEDYPSFNAFFTRALKPGCRPVNAEPNALVSPVDGAISQLGPICDGEIFQAKGHSFSTQSLLGLPAPVSARFAKGSFATIYLSPRDYHRVHLPFEGELLETCYIPGKLFSVNDTTTRHIPGLFARNERLVCLFDTAHGLMAVVLVGALFVAGIESVWQPLYLPKTVQNSTFAPATAFAKGDEIGRFKFGSTVIVLTERPLVFETTLAADSKVKMGETLGTYALCT